MKVSMVALRFTHLGINRSQGAHMRRTLAPLLTLIPLSILAMGQQDCGNSDDLDQDGWTGADGDCDDDDPGTYPGAAEVCDDGTDNDCDGVIDNGCGTTRCSIGGCWVSDYSYYHDGVQTADASVAGDVTYGAYCVWTMDGYSDTSIAPNVYLNMTVSYDPSDDNIACATEWYAELEWNEDCTQASGTAYIPEWDASLSYSLTPCD
ncbi:MAG: putative metal-binding motif-containing protein [Anaerolineae bacterium]|nr:putative metal-binding motif-containing protein [Anaerolineae bacterium]